MMDELRQVVEGEELTYHFLVDFLYKYANPRNKISRLLASGDLLRVKKGLYVFGQKWRRHPLSNEILANLIYGPSALSLEYALSYYGLIPERVVQLTSVTSGRSKAFMTPVGEFVYTHIPSRVYASGITRQSVGEGRFFLIASPEKALCDRVYLTGRFSNLAELESYLLDDLRIEKQAILNLQKNQLHLISGKYGSHAPRMLGELIRRWT